MPLTSALPVCCQGHRFVLAVENTDAGAPVSEKIVNAFLAGAVPIYMGASDVGE